MRTLTPYSSLKGNSWAEDFTPSGEIRQKYMYVQCMGHYEATPSYSVISRSNLHSHLLLYTKRGKGVIRYQGKEVFLPEKSSVIINGENPHTYYCAPDGEWNFYWIHFSGSCIDGYLSEIDENWDVNDKDIGDVFHQIYDSSRRGDPILQAIESSTQIIDLCSKFLIDLKRHQQKGDQALSPVVRSAVYYLEEHLSGEISLDRVCERLGISKFYLSHLFKEQTGSGVYEYLIALRLSCAKSLLRSTTQPVSEIAARCGFGSSSYFIQVFRKHESMTPLQYRSYFLQRSEE